MERIITPSNRIPPVSSTPSPRSEKIYSGIIVLLRSLHRAGHESFRDPGFRESVLGLYGLVDQWQHSRLQDEERAVTCTQGCAQCCSHWVEDVYSFEAEIIADYCRRTMPRRIGGILARFESDAAYMAELEKETRLQVVDPLVQRDMQENQWDEVDLLLATFYTQNRPCAFVDRSGQCMIYPVRPLTCRAYYSYAPARLCAPQHGDDPQSGTFMLDLGEDANTILDALHFRHDRFDGDTSLRTMLITCLSETVAHEDINRYKEPV